MSDADDDDVFAMVHRDMAEGRARKQAHQDPRKKYTDRRWMARSKAFLEEHPHCICCATVGLIVPSTIADHVTPTSHGNEDFYLAPLQALCADPCHNRVKRRLEHMLRRRECKIDDLRMDSEKAARMRGDLMPCDVDGRPTNPFHPWYRKKT
jgi:5-methylcytosine-specific restriction endonuclease McrA